jgi:xanthine dehydrogenase YagR molybdenum-binding subunit
VTDLIQALRTPFAEPGTGAVSIGMEVARVDGRDKVTGQARYAAEHPAHDLLYGVVVNAVIPRGRIKAIHDGAALAVPGVVDVVTHLNRPRIRSFDIFYKDMTAPGGSPFRPLYDENIAYSGQQVSSHRSLLVNHTYNSPI